MVWSTALPGGWFMYQFKLLFLLVIEYGWDGGDCCQGEGNAQKRDMYCLSKSEY